MGSSIYIWRDWSLFNNNWTLDQQVLYLECTSLIWRFHCVLSHQKRHIHMYNTCMHGQYIPLAVPWGFFQIPLFVESSSPLPYKWRGRGDEISHSPSLMTLYSPCCYGGPWLPSTHEAYSQNPTIKRAPSFIHLIACLNALPFFAVPAAPLLQLFCAVASQVQKFWTNHIIITIYSKLQ